MIAERGQALMTETEEACWGILQRHRGAENAVTRLELSRELGVADRQVRLVISSLINLHGKIVLSGFTGGGYYVPASRAEIDATISKLKKQGLSIFHRMSVLNRHIAKQALENIQMELDLK